jgi:hypothetical protein
MKMVDCVNYIIHASRVELKGPLWVLIGRTPLPAW